MNKNEINIPNIKKMLHDRLKTSGWLNILGPIINSNKFDEIIYFLKTEVKNNRRFTPKIKDIFKTFEECPYNDLKVIFINQDPYPQLGVPDGIAFSCSKTKPIEPSLRYIFKELNESQWDTFDPDLKKWSNQGVLMLNTAFTVQISKIGSHYSLWKSVTEIILNEINNNHRDIPVVLLGAKSEEWCSKLRNQQIFKVSHPASAKYKDGVWDSDNIFFKINKTLNEQNKKLISW